MVASESACTACEGFLGGTGLARKRTSAMRGFSGVLFGEKGKAAASGMRRQNLVPVRLRGALKLLKLRSHNGLVNKRNHRVRYLTLSIS